MSSSISGVSSSLPIGGPSSPLKRKHEQSRDSLAERVSSASSSVMKASPLSPTHKNRKVQSVPTDKYGSPVRPTRTQAAPPISPEFGSPSRLHSATELENMVASANGWRHIQTKLNAKGHLPHTVCPPSAEKDVNAIRNHRRKIKAKTRETNPSPIKASPNTKISVKRNEITVERKRDDGRETSRLFGFHKHEDGTTFYPKRGDDLVTLTGTEAVIKLADYYTTKPELPLIDFLSAPALHTDELSPPVEVSEPPKANESLMFLPRAIRMAKKK